jgi:uncharacterized membrane protein
MKHRFLTAILFSALPALFFISCSKTSADQQTMNPPPPGNGTTSCDTADMKYAADVVPILQAHCYACHGSNSNAGSGGILLDSYNDLKTYADNGYLKGNITHATGYIGMPYGQPKLDDCTINKIVDWINQGAQNN